MCFSKPARPAATTAAHYWRAAGGAQIQFNGFSSNEYVNSADRQLLLPRLHHLQVQSQRQNSQWNQASRRRDPPDRTYNADGRHSRLVPAASPPLADSEMNTVSTGGGGGGGGSMGGKKGSQLEELVATSPSQRNWRGIFIALLVIAAVLGLIIFSIFLLSPTDEGSRIKGHRLTLADVIGDALKPRPVNASWISDAEIVYRDTTGGLSILNLDNFTISTLMTNSTFRQLNAVKFSVSPDVKYVLLLSDLLPPAEDDGGGGDEQQMLARYHVFEVQARNQFPLSHKDGGVQLAPHLQHVLWAPNSQSIIDRHVQRQSHYREQGQLKRTAAANNQQSGSAYVNRATNAAAGAHGDGSTPAAGPSSSLPNNLSTQSLTTAGPDGTSGGGSGGGGTPNVGKLRGPDSKLLQAGGGGSLGGLNNNQAIAFVHENDIYYKPKVQQDFVCRITSTGRRGVIYNGIPDWFYANVAELRGPTLAFSPDSVYLSFISFNDTNVNEYMYTHVGEGLHQRYPEVKSIRYPKAYTPNPNVTVFVVNLSNPKFVFPQPIRLPDRIHWHNDSYVGAMAWASKTDLSVTLTNRGQTNATTVLCSAPQFQCRIIYVEESVENTTVLPSDMPIFSQLTGRDSAANSNGTAADVNSSQKQTKLPPLGGKELLLKRLPVRDGEFGFFRHIVVITTANSRGIPITMGRHEVVEILGWDEANEKVYYLGTLEDKPGQRHLFEVPLHFNYTEKSARLYVEPTSSHCLTCDNSPATYSLLNQNFTNNFTSKRPSNHTDTIQMKADYAQQPTSSSNSLSGSGGGGGGGQSGQLPATSTTSTTHVKTGKVFLKPSHEPVNQNKLNFLDSLIKLKLNRDDDEDKNKNLIRNNCLYNKIKFSPDFSYYLQECLGPERPATFLVSTKTNKKIFVLDSNDQLTDKLNDLALPQVRKMSVELKEGSVAQVRLFLPPDLKDEEEVAFPLILQMDASPGSQLVDEQFRVDWNWYLAGTQQMIVAQIDGRGSGYQGELLKAKVVGRLGGPEIEDQLAILTYLRDTFSYIDRRKICAYGWGYGGYAATMTLMQDTNKVVECAVAINPITSFSLYHSFFTERYIPTTDDFVRSVQESDLGLRSSQLDDRNLYIVHGTEDKTVHQQHAMVFARELISKDIVFRQLVYPDEGHRLVGVLSHLYKSIEEYFEDMFGPADRDEWDPAGFFAFKQ